MDAFNTPVFSGTSLPLTLKEVAGYAWIFEYLTVYTENVNDFLGFLSGSKRKTFGKFLGVIKTAIPDDGYHILYEYRKDTPRFKQRQAERKTLAKLGLSRRKMKWLKIKGQQTLTRKSSLFRDQK